MTDLMHKAEIQQMVRAAYLAVDVPRGAGAVYYTADQLGDLPRGAVDWSFGVGNPHVNAALPPGARVLDVGCGAGIDVLLAARSVGPDGHVIGLDLLPEMCARARANAAEAGLDNVEIVEGEMEAIPLPDDAVDAIISNGVINLSARKMRALFECARVLRPGGYLCLTDVTLDERDLPPEVLLHPAAWSGCAAGAMAERALLRALGRVGLVDVEVRERHPFGVADCARFPLFTPGPARRDARDDPAGTSANDRDGRHRHRTPTRQGRPAARSCCIASRAQHTRRQARPEGHGEHDPGVQRR